MHYLHDANSEASVNINSEDLRSFIAVADMGHVSAAADALGVSQPTLSRRIARVERAFGGTLFERNGRGIELNMRGRVVLLHARRADQELVNARKEVQRLLDPEHGTVRLDFMHSLGTWMVPDFLRAYRAKHPHVDFQLHQGAAQDLTSRVLSGESDLALIAPRPKLLDALSGWAPLFSQRLALAIPLDHPLARKNSPIRLEEAHDVPFVGMLPGFGTRMLLDDLAHRAGFTPQLVFESMELTTVIGLVGAGLGVGLVPLDDPYLVPKNVVLRPLTPVVKRELGMVWRKESQPAPAVEQFRTFILDRSPALVASAYAGLS